jgi:hypothetical protein
MIKSLLLLFLGKEESSLLKERSQELFHETPHGARAPWIGRRVVDLSDARDFLIMRRGPPPRG